MYRDPAFDRRYTRFPEPAYCNLNRAAGARAFGRQPGNPMISTRFDRGVSAVTGAAPGVGAAALHAGVGSGIAWLLGFNPVVGAILGLVALGAAGEACGE